MLQKTRQTESRVEQTVLDHQSVLLVSTVSSQCSHWTICYKLLQEIRWDGWLLRNSTTNCVFLTLHRSKLWSWPTVISGALGTTWNGYCTNQLGLRREKLHEHSTHTLLFWRHAAHGTVTSALTKSMQDVLQKKPHADHQLISTILPLWRTEVSQMFSRGSRTPCSWR